MIKLISGEFCSRCHLIAPLLKKYAEENNLSFIEIDINNASLSKNISYDLNDLLSKYGLEIKKGSENKILVTVDIEKIN